MFEIHQSSDGEWRWRLKDGNHEIVATSGGEGYTRSHDCWRAIDNIKSLVPSASVKVVD
jgi:uncharacterized protein YegP (UPF0339 family)